MHTTEPGLTVGIKQIKCLPSALSMMQGQSTVDSAEVGNSKLLRRAVPQTQNTFGRAAYYCLDEADLSEILDSDQPALRLYLKGIFQAAAGCCCMNWLLQPEMTLSYTYSILRSQTQRLKRTWVLECLNPSSTSMFLHRFCLYAYLLFH